MRRPPPRRPPASRRASRLAAAILALLALPPAARAGEQEWVLAPGLGYGVLEAAGRARHGGALTADLDYGLTDSWSLRASLHWSGLSFSGSAAGDGGGATLLTHAGAGIGALYVFDVLQVVPYVSLTLGAAATGGGALPWRWNAEARAGVGLDWLVRRELSLGLELRYGLLLPDIGRFPFAITLVARLAWRKP